MAIDKEEVRRIARLAYLELPRVHDEEGTWCEPAEHLIDDAALETLARDLGKILDYVRQLEELDLEGVEPTSHGVPLPPLFREDVVEPPLDLPRALASAPSSAKEMFAVPKVIE